MSRVYLHQQIGGSGPNLVLSHSLSSNMSMWDAQREVLERHFTVIRFDTRGHGKSDAPAGPYTMDELADDAAGLLDELGLTRAVWVGISLGGMIGQVLALARPDLVDRLVLADTTSGYPPEAKQSWSDRIASVEKGGMDAVVDGTLSRWLTDGFRAANPDAVARIRSMILSTDPSGFIGCANAVSGFAVGDRIGAIACPTLVLVGEFDQATPPDMARGIAAAIPNAVLEVIPGAAHQSAIEQPDLFNRHLLSFLDVAVTR